MLRLANLSIKASYQNMKYQYNMGEKIGKTLLYTYKVDTFRFDRNTHFDLYPHLLL